MGRSNADAEILERESCYFINFVNPKKGVGVSF
jgi:hypothetical protein